MRAECAYMYACDVLPHAFANGYLDQRMRMEKTSLFRELHCYLLATSHYKSRSAPFTESKKTDLTSRKKSGPYPLFPDSLSLKCRAHQTYHPSFPEVLLSGSLASPHCVSLCSTAVSTRTQNQQRSRARKMRGPALSLVSL